jgi:hypothetical protein
MANLLDFSMIIWHSHIADCCKDYNFDFVAISETGKRNYSQSLLNWLSGGLDFEWFSRPPCGWSGGMLVGVRADTMDVLASFDREYHIKLTIRNKADDFIWSLVAIYGAAQDAFKGDFLCELFNSPKIISIQ